MAASKNYYEEIGVSQNASVEEITNTVKQLVKTNHPDNFTDAQQRENAQQRLRVVKRAYETLKDENLRLEYDLSLVNDTQTKPSNAKSKTSSFKFISGLILGTAAVTASGTIYLSGLDCSNQRNVVDATICEKTQPIRSLFGSDEKQPVVAEASKVEPETIVQDRLVSNQTPVEASTPKIEQPKNEPAPALASTTVSFDNSTPVKSEPELPTATASFQPVASTPVVTTNNANDECYNLWYQRNLAYAQKGYCFESNLGKRVFSGFKCSQTPEPLSATEKDKITQIKQKESSLNCRLNTDSTEVPSSAPIASQIQPAVTLQPAQPSVQQPINTAPAPAIQTVIVEGVGTTPQDAAQNAAQNALTNVVGTFIDANTMLQKRTLINDGIKTETKNISKDIKDYSQGSIKSFELLETKQESGLFRVNAKVTVRNENFSAYIKQIAQGEVSVGNDLYAKMATGIKQKDNLTAILKDNVILPILSGEVQDIEAEKPMLLSEAIEEKKLPEWLLRTVKFETHTPNTLIFKVNTHLKDSFFDQFKSNFVKHLIES